MSDLAEKEEKNTDEGILKKYALVITDVKGLGTQAFSYNIPEDIRKKIKYGSPVVVPFRGKNAVNGFVVGFTDEIYGKYKIKTIIDILDEKAAFTPEYMQLLMWTAKYYVCDLNSVIQTACGSKLFGKYKTKIIRTCENYSNYCDKLTNEETKLLSILPYNEHISDITIKRKLNFSKEKYSNTIRKLKSKELIKTENILDEKKLSEKKQKLVKINSDETNNLRYKKILQYIKDKDNCTVATVIKEVKTTLQTLKKMETEGLIQIFEKQIFRNPLSIYSAEKRTDFPKLSNEQQEAYNKIVKKIENGQTEPILIHGITASGKTELYFALMKKVIDEGKNVLLLAPEIAIASMLTKKTALRFGVENVGIWHSSISDAEKNDIRKRLQNNEIKILVGARSAVFAPIKNIGLIVIDEEHENSYKQTSPPPYYNACEVAEKLAIINKAVIIKGSATPDICSYYKAKKSNNLIEMKERYNQVSLAPVEIVDMREEFSYKGQRYISNYLKEKINENLQAKKQTILLMNRLGFSTKVQCSSCGAIITCPNCSVALVYHKKSNSYKCHWCNFEQKAQDNCPKCGSKNIKYTGMGTEKTEEIIQKIFPKARIERFDSENLKGKYAHNKILSEFQNGKIDILIGTQMSAKGLDNENVTLVGVINSDNSFVFHDFRAAERGFQLLTQVAGRAGRGSCSGKVIFQTYNPDFSVIKFAKEQNYQKFYEEEIELRKEFGYPPFSQVIRFIVTGEKENRVEQAAMEISERLNKIIEKNLWQNKIQISPVTSCIIEKINNDFRYEFLIKNFTEKEGLALISKFYKTIRLPKDLKVKIDVSPIDLI